jgi:hypothetical protein
MSKDTVDGQVLGVQLRREASRAQGLGTANAFGQLPSRCCFNGVACQEGRYPCDQRLPWRETVCKAQPACTQRVNCDRSGQNPEGAILKAHHDPRRCDEGEQIAQGRPRGDGEDRCLRQTQQDVQKDAGACTPPAHSKAGQQYGEGLQRDRNGRERQAHLDQSTKRDGARYGEDLGRRRYAIVHRLIACEGVCFSHGMQSISKRSMHFNAFCICAARSGSSSDPSRTRRYFSTWIAASFGRAMPAATSMAFIMPT